MNFHRIKSLIMDMISTLKLDLSGLTILTEAATGYYALTPIIAAMAGADSVYAMTRNSRFGTVADVVDLNNKLSRQFQGR